MLTTTTQGNGTVADANADATQNQTMQVGENGFPAEDEAVVEAFGRIHLQAPEAPSPNGMVGYRDERPALAVFCYDSPDSYIGGHVCRIVAALAQRWNIVHLFSPHAFPLDGQGITVHALGDCGDGDVVSRAHEFARRAAGAFGGLFPTGSNPVALIGYEWSAIPALSLLRPSASAGCFLSLHSLERRRTDLSSEISKQIEAIELSGLRDAQRILIHEPATAEVARYWVPECADRIVYARSLFPTAEFRTDLDPGAVKARYQVGPIDPTILYIGDLSERYGPDLLVKALPGLLRNNPQIRLIVAGDGQDYWPLRVYTRYLLLEHAVRLPGSIEGQQLRELVQAADVIAVPSREATPWWPILAAWAARRPVVATHQAAPSLLEHEQDSVLVYPAENSFVWGVERVLFDPELRDRITEAGSRKLEERFGWNGLAAQVEEMMGVVQTA